MFPNVNIVFTNNVENKSHSIVSFNDAIFSAIVDPAIVYDGEMNICRVNKAFTTQFGIDPVGINLKDLITLFSTKWIDDSRYLIEEQPTARALKGEYVTGSIFSIKFMGSEHFVETSSGPIMEQGRITGALTVWHIIDDVVKIQKAFLKSVEFHRRTNDYSPVGVIITKNNFIEYANATALKLLGAKHLLDVEGKVTTDFIHPNFQFQFARKLQNLSAGKIFEEAEQKIISLDGKVYDLEIKAVNISNETDKIYQIFLRDITSEKKINHFNNILSVIEQVIHSSVSNLDIAQKAMEIAAQAIECNSAAVSFYNQNDWEIKHIYNFPDNVKGLLIPSEDEPHALLALREKKIILIEDAHTDSRVNNEKLKNWGIRSVIVVPLYTKFKDIGVIFFNYHNPKKFNHEEIYFLIRFSTTLSLALENSGLFENLQHELDTKDKNEKKLLKLNRTLLALSRSSQAMVLAKSEDEYINQISNIIIHDCEQALVFVGILEEDELQSRCCKINPEIINDLISDSDKDTLFSRPGEIAVNNRKPFVCTNLSRSDDSGWKREALKNGLVSCISLPLLYQDNVYGVLTIYSVDLYFYAEEEILLLSELSKYLIQGITSIRLNNAKKLAEAFLKESEERFRMLTEKSNALICELDYMGNVLYSNQKYQEIFGKSPGSSILESCRQSDQVTFIRNLTSESQGLYKTEWVLKDKNDNWRWFRCHPGLFSNSKGEQRFSLILFDISDSKNLEQQLKKSAKELKELNATKDKFFNIIAHDLKNPFANLIGASDLLNSNNYDIDTNHRLGKIIKDSAIHGYNLLQNLLDWSRSQAGTISFYPQKIILKQLIIECWESVKTSAINKSQKFEIAVAEDITVIADVNMLSTILRNLLQNASKFTHNNGNIKISAIPQNNEVIISVEDSGIGISKEDITKLFRIDVKFSRAGTNKENGTGLGLLLCREFIEKHNGKIWVKSIKGGGSKFFISIPSPPTL